MSIETGVIFDYDMKPIYWHLPFDRSAGHIGDSRDLFLIMMENKGRIYGFAHSHPGSGLPSPSWTDLTTFSAVERGLGKRLVWPIVTKDRLRNFFWQGPDEFDYKDVFIDAKFYWLSELRYHSYKLGDKK